MKKAIVNRRKPRKYKTYLKQYSPTSSRTEMTPIQRAFAAGAILAGNASANGVAKLMKRDQSNISKMVKRIKERVEFQGLSLWDSLLYTNEIGRGRPELLDAEQKKLIIKITTSTRESREKESWQAIADGDYKGKGLPKISITTLENVMYEAGYARRRPGWKPILTPAQEEERYQWALIHNPDKYKEYDGLGFNFRIVCFTDETPARVGEQRGMFRAWAKDDEIYHEDVKKDKKEKFSTLQFYGAFMYNHKGPYHIYSQETKEEKEEAEEALNQENKERRNQALNSQETARRALNYINEPDVNLRRNTPKKQYTKKDNYHRGIRTRGGVDGYRHREGALKKVVKWMNSLKELGVDCKLLEDGAPPHKSRIANDFLHVHYIEKISWPGHSPDVNASEHAWPWQRKYVTKQFKPSDNERECKKQWGEAWEDIPIEVINKWVDGIPEVVRRIIRNKGKNNFHG